MPICTITFLRSIAPGFWFLSISRSTRIPKCIRWSAGNIAAALAKVIKRAFLFTEPTDGKGARYDMAVLVAGLAANPDVYRIGFGRPLEEIGAAWVRALAAPIEPRIVVDAPCQEFCTLGDALDAPGAALDGLPVLFFSACRRSFQPRSSTISARSRPMPPISTSSRSPGRIQSGGLRLWPTPSGVPVAMTSPAESTVKSEQNAMICGIE